MRTTRGIAERWPTCRNRVRRRIAPLVVALGSEMLHGRGGVPPVRRRVPRAHPLVARGAPGAGSIWTPFSISRSGALIRFPAACVWVLPTDRRRRGGETATALRATSSSLAALAAVCTLVARGACGLFPGERAELYATGAAGCALVDCGVPRDLLGPRRSPSFAPAAWGRSSSARPTHRLAISREVA